MKALLTDNSIGLISGRKQWQILRKHDLVVEEILAFKDRIIEKTDRFMEGGGTVHFSSFYENGHRVCRWEEY